MPLRSAASLLLILAACASDPVGSPLGSPTGKADGPGSCNAAETALFRCMAERCAEASGGDEESCFYNQCGQFVVPMSETCEACFEGIDSDAAAAVEQCGGDTPAPPPCGDSPEFIECATTECAGLNGDPLFGCLDDACGENVSEMCETCIFLKAGLGAEALPACLEAPGAPDIACSAGEMEALSGCAATPCASLSGEELTECIAANCDESILESELAPQCLYCVGSHAEAGSDLDATMATCSGETSGPACSVEELAPWIACDSTSCSGMIGDALDVCMQEQCSDISMDDLGANCIVCLGEQFVNGSPLATSTSVCGSDL